MESDSSTKDINISTSGIIWAYNYLQQTTMIMHIQKQTYKQTKNKQTNIIKRSEKQLCFSFFFNKEKYVHQLKLYIDVSIDLIKSF